MARGGDGLIYATECQMLNVDVDGGKREELR
jgi:hypothetical protein